MEGRRIDDLEFLSEHNISPRQVSTALTSIFDEMTFISGHLHCDPHLGNLLVQPHTPTSPSDPNFRIVLLDHGLYRYLPQQLRVDYAQLWLSIINNDIPRMKYYSQLVANVPPERFTLFASAMTGRDYGGVVRGEMAGLKVPRSVEEVARIRRGNVGGKIMLALVDLLSNMPRIMLLLLKTNDLTRYTSCNHTHSPSTISFENLIPFGLRRLTRDGRALDESLHIESTERNFLVMTRYCAKAVFLDRVSNEGAWGKLSAWWLYFRTLLGVRIYEYYLDFRDVRDRLRRKWVSTGEH